MGDSDITVEQRKENIKKFFSEKLKFGNKDLLYLFIYIVLMIIVYFTFKGKFRTGISFLFIIVPIISIILLLLKKPVLAALLNIIAFSFILRIQNLSYLIDVTTQQYIPADPDAMAFLRYAQYINEHGSLMSVDTLRYFPYGFTGLQEFSFLSNFIVYLYKFLDIFTNFSLELVDIIYPAIAFAVSLVFFFLLVKNLFDEKTAVLSTAFLAFVPSYLFRTLTGISDKEALATVFLFAALYFYVLSWKSENNKKALLFGALSGAATALTNLIWGGGVFLFLLVGIFAIIELLLNKFSKKDFLGYFSWILLSVLLLMIIYGEKYNIGALLLSATTAVAIFPLGFYLVDLFIFKKNILKIKFIENIKEKHSRSLISLIAMIFIGAIFMFLVFGGEYFIGVVKHTFSTLTIPFATDRWVRTVAENSQPYITDWIGQFGIYFLWMFILGSALLFYEMHKNVKSKLTLTITYFVLLIGFIFSRYSPNTILNGTSPLSIIIYVISFVGLFLLFVVPYIYYHYKNKEISEEISKIDKRYLFMLIWFIIMIIAARGAVRLLFIFSPVVSVLVSYLIIRLYELSKTFKSKIYTYSTTLIFLVIAFLLLSTFSQTSLAQASSVGPTYNQQWQYMGQWIRENTPEDSVFAHWWDYGYLVQYNNRATISDGGNAGGYETNYFTGRHVLTGQTYIEALEYLKSKNVSHLLIISDEIGKYPAYSSIGSDINYDRYSWITTFQLDPQRTQETRNETLYFYLGGFPLDKDFVYQGKVYPRQAAGIGAIILPIEEIANNSSASGYIVKTPRAIVVYNSEQLQLPLKCLYFNNELYEFDDGVIDGCLRVIPTINNEEVNPIGAGLYLSPKVKNSLFAHLYLYDEENENFKVGYSDESQIPLALYNGRLIGPYKIWEVNYPKDLKVPAEYYKRELPDIRVTQVKEGY